ncbi:DUF2070 family protein, partial [[Eubacterium] cellulosolvens]
APEPTDDIDYPTGESIIIRGENETKSKALFIDAHNCLEPGTGQVFFGSEKANNMLKLVSKLNKELGDTSSYEILTGYASDTSLDISEGLGPMGIQVLVVRCEPAGKMDNYGTKEYAYILLDGNNIVCGLREQILEAITDLVDDAEVFTTDNHIVNATMGGYNPVGLKVDPNRIIRTVKHLVNQAKRKFKPCEVGMNSGFVKKLRILGKTMPMRLSTTINSTIAIMKDSLIACQALALAACWLIAMI